MLNLKPLNKRPATPLAPEPELEFHRYLEQRGFIGTARQTTEALEWIYLAKFASQSQSDRLWDETERHRFGDYIRHAWGIDAPDEMILAALEPAVPQAAKRLEE